MPAFNKTKRKELCFFLLMGVFGCLGPIIRAVNLPPAAIACARAWIAGISLLIWALLTKTLKKGCLCGTLKNMIISGALLAGDWIGLFISYNYTTIATATVCYYIAPIFMIIGSVLILGDKLPLRHLVCIILSFAGLVLVSGFLTPRSAGEASPAGSPAGPLFALIGAVSYTGIILINKKHPEGNPIAKTMVQFFVAAALTTPYVLLSTDVSTLSLSLSDIMLLLLLGVFVTAAAYVVYFRLITDLSAKSIAICSYADPLVALLISFIFLHEPVTAQGIAGSVLIIGSSLASELI